MKNTALVENASVETDDMRDEYQFDYSKAKPNRFADRIAQDQLMIGAARLNRWPAVGACCTDEGRTTNDERPTFVHPH